MRVRFERSDRRVLVNGDERRVGELDLDMPLQNADLAQAAIPVPLARVTGARLVAINVTKEEVVDASRRPSSWQTRRRKARRDHEWR
jgi:hypothetical protein